MLLCVAVEFPSARVVFTALAFFGILNIYCLRVNLSVALVAMVNATEHHNITENMTDDCGNIIKPKDANATEVRTSTSTTLILFDARRSALARHLLWRRGCLCVTLMYCGQTTESIILRPSPDCCSDQVFPYQV